MSAGEARDRLWRMMIDGGSEGKGAVLGSGAGRRVMAVLARW